MNAILLAKRSLANYTLYVWPFISCDRCAVHVIQSGIKRVVAPIPDKEKLERWKKSFDLSESYFKEAGVEVLQIEAQQLFVSK
jgi:deoxycytidylate deaminase